MDIKDFFPSIKFNRVKGMFYSFGYSEGISTILALLTTESERKQVIYQGKKYFIAFPDYEYIYLHSKNEMEYLYDHGISSHIKLYDNYKKIFFSDIQIKTF